MDKQLLTYCCISLFGVFISAVSQVLLKKAAMKKYDSVIKEYLNPRVIIAYVIFVGATFVSIVAYKVVPLSMGPVLEATSYIYVTILGITIFKEKFNIKKLIALLFIIAGIVVYAVVG